MYQHKELEKIKKMKNQKRIDKFLCPICGEPAIEREFGADFEYIYITGKCKNNHRFGIKRQGTKDELGKGREAFFRNRIKILN